jgi:hypothetical protein
MPETDSGSTGEADGTDYSWDVKLACRKDTLLQHYHLVFERSLHLVKAVIAIWFQHLGEPTKEIRFLTI